MDWQIHISYQVNAVLMDAGKIENIKEAIKARESVIIAFSGGVDSSTLAALAFEALGERALAVTISSPFFPENQLKQPARQLRRLESDIK